MYDRKVRARYISFVSLFVGILLTTTGLLVFAGLETQRYITALEQLAIPAAQLHSNRAKQIVRPLSFLTFKAVPVIESWYALLRIGDDLENLSFALQSASASLATNTTALTIDQLVTPLKKIHEKVLIITQVADTSPLLQKIISSQNLHRATGGEHQLQLITTLLESLTQGTQTWLILFQNSDELRATGGFTGSYALVTFSKGKLAEIVVEDIYDADGQFTGYIEAPPGVKEYTSNNHGLRLPDANWFPHFPKSAQTQLQFFALGDKRNISGVIAINTAVAKSILSATGPVRLPDYPTTVTESNFDTVLRDDRADFFPGSLQKKHILSQLISVLKQKIAQLPQEKQLELAKALVAGLPRKDIQFYAIKPDIQAIFHELGISGEVGLSPWTKKQIQTDCTATTCATPHLLYLVESNIGINKANQFVTRSVDIYRQTAQKMHVVIKYTNTGQKDASTLLGAVVGRTANPKLSLATNGYANYQRVLTSRSLQLTQVRINGEPQKSISQELLTIEPNTFQQSGFLVETLPQENTIVELDIETTDQALSFDTLPLLIQKQSGVGNPIYTIHTSGQDHAVVLETDQLIELK
ncbi:DUF4012 domain-containing protein [Candidatus Woesebacteria bacterium]|nr:DUF4012 domain-containing protein [Candidatus Woesebacteria bacterium]